jgi:hypothetical protein
MEQQQQQSHGNRIDAQSQVTKYKHFLDMNSLQCTKAEEALDVDAWIRAMAAMFAVCTLPCSNGRKAKFTVLQLHGFALMWWEHYKSMQPPGYEISWEEFKKAFRYHHIPKALPEENERVIGYQARARHIPICADV